MGQVSEKNIFLLGLHFPCIINLSPHFFTHLVSVVWISSMPSFFFH